MERSFEKQRGDKNISIGHGRKEVPLGTGHTMKQPWLSDLDTPLGVVAISGAVYNRNGGKIALHNLIAP